MSKCPEAFDTPFDAMKEPGKGIKRGVECVKCDGDRDEVS